jgi:hypothetical protein
MRRPSSATCPPAARENAPQLAARGYAEARWSETRS